MFQSYDHKCTATFFMVQSVETQLRWKPFAVLCNKFIQDTTYQLLSESDEFYRRYKNVLVYFFLWHGVYINYNNQTYKTYTNSVAECLVISHTDKYQNCLTNNKDGADGRARRSLRHSMVAKLGVCSSLR